MIVHVTSGSFNGDKDHSNGKKGKRQQHTQLTGKC